MKAGLLRHKITVEQQTVTRDKFGGEVLTWSKYLSAYARVKPVSSKEYFAAKQTQSERITMFVFRYGCKIAQVTAKMRLVWGSRIFDIEGPPINENERDRELVIMGSEKDV